MNREDIVIINIEDEEIIDEMSRIGFINKEINPKIEGSESAWMCSREGAYVPHFHVKRKGKKDVCIKIESAEYFIHGSKTDKLSQEECRWLDSMLRKKLNNKMTYWEYTIIMWNTTNAGREENWLPEDLKQPDYTKLNK